MAGVRERMTRLLSELGAAYPPPTSPAVFTKPVRKKLKVKGMKNRKYTELSKDHLQIPPPGTQP